jgi:hypothetical protein
MSKCNKKILLLGQQNINEKQVQHTEAIEPVSKTQIFTKTRNKETK